MPGKFEFSYSNIVRLAITVLSVAMVAYHVWAIAFGSPEAVWYRGTHLLFAVLLVFLLHRRNGAIEGLPTVLDLVLLALAVAPILYLFVNYEYVINRIFYVDDLTPLDMTMGVLMTIMVLEATRRVIGLALPITALVFLAYGLFIARLAPEQLIDQLYMTTEGIFGIPLSVSAAYVLIFVLFGSFMERTGTGQLFMDFAMSLTGHTAGGPGKVSCVSSSLFGTISGSAVANVMVDGPITIPLMKRSGFPKPFAAGVEAVASTGGQIMPPIMGAAAFVMAEFIGVPYGQVVIWALIPAILYYVACFSAVHFEAKRRGLVGVPRSELPRMRDVMAQRGHMFLPVLSILVVMYSGFSAPMAALAGVAACFPVAALSRTTRHYVTWRNFIGACVDGAQNALTVALACAAAGVIIAVVTLSGLGIVFTQFVVDLASNYLLIALILTMIAGIVLGMGMPTTPAYIIMTALLVPAIIKFGVVVPAAHMFAFYFAVLSAITPPVALAIFAAAGIAKSGIWETGVAAMRIAATSFIIPFMFVYEPALLMIGDWPTIIWKSCTAGFGVMLFAAGLHGYFITHSRLWQSLLLVAGGLMLIDPGYVTDLIGASCAVIVAATQYFGKRAPQLAPVKNVISD
ncbi:MAG TPA: TRAP transporter permease [Xanthobacteraceae bacterium]|nr:TRAP transporter permease [Xanthobacteraceae bacterium]